MYNIPLKYVTDVLFAKTAQGLVQGMASTSATYTNQSVSLIATFGTSNPVLLCVVLALNVVCALSATLASILPRSARQAAPLDVARLLAISRNPELDTVLKPYSNKSVKMDDELLSAGVGYGWDENSNQYMLTILPGWRNQDVSVTANDSTSAMTLSQRHGGVIGLGDLKEYSPVESEAD